MVSSPAESVVEIYHLDLDANRYAALQCVDINDLDRFAPFDGSPMLKRWEPVAMFWETEDGTSPKSDFGGPSRAPVFNTRALEALYDLLEGRGELLPLEVEGEEQDYFAFNCTRISDALDEERSQLAYFRDGGIMGIDHHEFIPERLSGETIFKLPQERHYEFVTDAFRRRVEQAGLTGFIWDRQVWGASEPVR